MAAVLAILGIPSGCRSARDLERFAKRHHQTFGAALDLELPKAPCDSTFLYLFERVEIEELFGLLREWMQAQISGQNKDFDQLICDGKTLKGSAAQPNGADGAPRFVTQVTLYARERGVAIAQTSFDTGESLPATPGNAQSSGIGKRQVRQSPLPVDTSTPIKLFAWLPVDASTQSMASLIASSMLWYSPSSCAWGSQQPLISR